MRPLERSNLRWGILGTANIAPAIMEAIRASGSGVVAAVASRELDRARAFADRYLIPGAFGSYEGMIESGAIDVVYDPLPNTLHAPLAIRALEAGLPVLVEKPFTPTLDEARSVAAAARAAKRPVAEAFMYRFHPLWDRVRALIDAGEIGELVSISSTFTFALDDRTALPARAELGGGALLDVGCYGVDLARQVARSEPKRAIAFARGEGIDDTLMATLELESGVLAHVTCSIEIDEHHGAEIRGTKGAIIIESPWFPGRDRGRLVLRRGLGTPTVVETPGGDGYELEVADFARAVVEGTDPRWPVEDAVKNVAVLEAILTSAAIGAAVAVERD